MRNDGKLVLALLAALLATAPGVGAQDRSQEADAFAEATKPQRTPVRVYVENHNFLDVDVFALRGATRIRLGTVRSSQGEFFDLPASATEAGNQLELLADPIGSRQQQRSGSLMINPGDIVEWRLGNSQSQSTIAVWST